MAKVSTDSRSSGRSRRRCRPMRCERPEGRGGRGAEVPALRMHGWPVVNETYEQGDPSHKANRRKNEGQDAHQPLADDGRCPVVNVTWFDAWCFAKWLDDEVLLPSEVQ